MEVLLTVYFVILIMTYFFLAIFLEFEKKDFWAQVSQVILILLLSAIWIISMPLITGAVLNGLLKGEEKEDA